MTKLEQFFYDNAGYSYGSHETKEEGRVRCAKALAKAAHEALEAGWAYSWSEESDGEVCRLWDAHEADATLLASLHAIEEPTAEYRRVVEAELAWDALGRSVESK